MLVVVHQDQEQCAVDNCAVLHSCHRGQVANLAQDARPQHCMDPAGAGSLASGVGYNHVALHRSCWGLVEWIRLSIRCFIGDLDFFITRNH